MPTIIEKKQRERKARVLNLGLRIRIERLDEEDGDEAKAAKLLEEHSEAELNEASDFAAYLAKHATTGCALCGGRGARVVRGDQHEVCDCVRTNVRRARLAQQEARKPFVSVSNTEHFDKRIAEAETVLANARAAQAAACAATDAEIAVFAPRLASFHTERKQRENALETVRGQVRAERKAIAQRDELDDASIASLERELQQLKKARAARSAKDEAALLEMRELLHGFEEELNRFDATQEPLKQQAAALEEKRRKLAGRFAQKIERQEKLLRRLRYLKGDSAIPGTASELPGDPTLSEMTLSDDVSGG